MIFKINIPKIGETSVEVRPSDSPYNFWRAEGVDYSFNALGSTIEKAVQNFGTGLTQIAAREPDKLKSLHSKRPIVDALILGGMQYLSWGICTISWRAVAQANILASIITDTSLATLTFFIFKRFIKSADENALIPWLGYTIGGVFGTISGIYLSIAVLGK